LRPRFGTGNSPIPKRFALAKGNINLNHLSIPVDTFGRYTLAGLAL
jgi:hypothetical protein